MAVATVNATNVAIRRFEPSIVGNMTHLDYRCLIYFCSPGTDSLLLLAPLWPSALGYMRLVQTCSAWNTRERENGRHLQEGRVGNSAA